MMGHIEIAVAKTEEIDATVRAQIIRLCMEAHSEPSFAHLFAWVPAGGLHVIAVQNGEAVGHAMVTTRWLQPAGLPVLRTAYVDAVSTAPTHQGKGIGSAVMRCLIDQLAGFEVACLETDKPAFYERLGWLRWRGRKAGRDGERLVFTPDEQIVMVYGLGETPAIDLDGLLTIECQTGRIW